MDFFLKKKMQELQESVDKNKAKMEEVKRGMLCNNYSD